MNFLNGINNEVDVVNTVNNLKLYPVAYRNKTFCFERSLFRGTVKVIVSLTASKWSEGIPMVLFTFDVKIRLKDQRCRLQNRDFNVTFKQETTLHTHRHRRRSGQR